MEGLKETIKTLSQDNQCLGQAKKRVSHKIMSASSQQEPTYWVTIYKLKLSLRRMGNGGIAPLFLTSALDGHRCSASCPGRLTPRERGPDTHCVGSWAGPRASLDVKEKRKVVSAGNRTLDVQTDSDTPALIIYNKVQYDNNVTIMMMLVMMVH
jgi:hypothetical protein